MKWQSISTTPSDMQYKPLCNYQMKIWVLGILLILRAKQVLCVTPKKCVWNSLKNAWISSWGEKIMCSMGISAFLTLEYYENMKYYKNIICSVGISAFSSLQHMIGAIQLSFFFWKASPHVSPDAQLRKRESPFFSCC